MSANDIEKNATAERDDLPALGRLFLFVEKDANLKRMIAGLAIVCALLFLADFVYPRYGKTEIEKIWGFYGIVGFISFSFIILSTKVLKRLIGRREDYYGDSAVDAESYPPEGLEVKDHGDA